MDTRQVKPPQMRSIADARFDLGGELAHRLEAVTRQWLLPAPYANPAMLEMFRNRDREPHEHLVPWAGEFAGKYLTHAVQIWRLTRDEALRQHLDWFVGCFTALQADDGYLGPWPEPYRLRAGAPNCRQPWDAWGHYHAMVGLLLWVEQTGDARARQCAQRIGELFCARFLGNAKALHDTGVHEMNLAPAHGMALLYRVTGDARHLELARQIEAITAEPPAGDYRQQALCGVPFHATPKPRWESLHPIMALAELYHLTGEETYREAFERLWWSMLEGDRHNTGGFTSGEKATGNPYDEGAIETCCTVAWMAMSVEMLRLTGDAIVADELELSMLNSGLGMMSPSGRWVTYDTPMGGYRRASAHQIVFQARPGSPELNCCSVNGPRAVGMLCEWAVMRRSDGLALNYYGPGAVTATLDDGRAVTLRQSTTYPLDLQTDITVETVGKGHFTLALRIPSWSARTQVQVNGEAVAQVPPGRYLELRRDWRSGDRIEVRFDARPHYWVWKRVVDDQPWVATWRVYGPLVATEATQLPTRLLLEAMAKHPADADTLHAERWTLTHGEVETDEQGTLRLGETHPTMLRGGVMVAETIWEAAQACTLPVRIDALRVLAVQFNGETLWRSAVWGSDAGREQFSVDLPVRAGVNRLSLIVEGRSAAWVTLHRATLTREQAEALPPSERAYLASIYHGPVLLAYDREYNDRPPDRVADLLASSLPGESTTTDIWLKPLMLRASRASDGPLVRLCDYASAGHAGTPYRTWLAVRFDTPPRSTFEPGNPLRSWRPA